MDKAPTDGAEEDQENKHEKSLDLRSKRGGHLLFDHSFFPDTVILRVRGRNFFVSASYLALSSPYFHELFYGQDSSELKGRYKLDVDPHTFGDLLDAAYPCYKRTNCCGDCSSSFEDRLNLALQLKLRPAVKRLIIENIDHRPTELKTILQENSAFDNYCHLLPSRHAAPEPEVMELRDCSDNMEPLLVTDAFPDSTTVVVRGMSVNVSATTLSIHSPFLSKLIYENGEPVKGVKIDMDIGLVASVLRAMTGDFPTVLTVGFLDDLLTLGCSYLYDVFLAEIKREALKSERSRELVPAVLIHLAKQPKLDIDCMKIYTNYIFGDYEELVLSKCDSLPDEVKDVLRRHHKEEKRITVFVKNIKGAHVSYEVCTALPLDHLKKQIEITERIHENDQRLIFAGKQLEDGRSLDYYKILRESTLHLVLRLRGC